MVPDNKFITEDGGKIDTIVCVGNGAVLGGWDPLREALDKWIDGSNIDKRIKGLQKQNVEAFHQLAIVSYKFRVAKTLVFKKWVEKKETPLSTAKAGYEPSLAGFIDLRQSIASEYEKDKSLKLRWSPEVKELLGDNVGYITTNWDSAALCDPACKNIIQLHGHSSLPQSLVFPTELLIEDTLFELKPFVDNILKADNAHLGFGAQTMEIFRYNAMRPLMDAAVRASKWIAGAKKIVIWGYSLGDYDADINALIGTYAQNKTGELVVINPDEKVFNRAMALTQIFNATFLNPLTNETKKAL